MERVRDLGELVAYLPHIIGHHPQASLVLLAMETPAPVPARPHRRASAVVCTVRADLPPTARDERAVVEHVMTQLARQPDVGGILAVTFEDGIEPGADPERALQRVRTVCAERGLELIETVRVRGDRQRVGGPGAPWRARVAPDAVPALAERVLAGSNPYASREALEETLRPGSQAAPVSRVLGATRSSGPIGPLEGRAVAAFWRALLTRPEHERRAPEPADVARLVRTLEDSHTRDALILWATPLSMSPLTADTPAAADLLVRLPMVHVRDRRPLEHLLRLLPYVPEERSVDALAAVASIAWWWGRGDVARIAVEGALARDPGHRLAGLLHALIGHGVRSPGVAPSS